jgi:ribosomal protein L11 methylase PrmA
VGDLRSIPASGAAEPAARNQAPGGADLVLANLTGALLVATAHHLLARTGRGGALILSGFQRHEASAVLAAFAAGADLVARQAEGDWEAALFRGR